MNNTPHGAEDQERTAENPSEGMATFPSGHPYIKGLASIIPHKLSEFAPKDDPNEKGITLDAHGKLYKFYDTSGSGRRYTVAFDSITLKFPEELMEHATRATNMISNCMKTPCALHLEHISGSIYSVKSLTLGSVPDLPPLDLTYP